MIALSPQNYIWHHPSPSSLKQPEPPSSCGMVWKGWEHPGWCPLGGLINSNSSITKFTINGDPNGYYHIYVKGNDGGLWAKIHDKYDDVWVNMGEL
jgi:hypothetical protein